MDSVVPVIAVAGRPLMVHADIVLACGHFKKKAGTHFLIQGDLICAVIANMDKPMLQGDPAEIALSSTTFSHPD